ncbi:hypothetical protein J5300_07460 [Riemerella anatipestifer]|uniref:hypothetical protein n=1 Tax=Riemerella anatipestifer TaxID=34085 RepID=UPI001BDA163B|nr:hypothetical protein [Riemerella anatipestifer]MBT0534080.1 hypothetical protein [Riemerella anatipestifer]MBT0540079.1 hypothetical protein [Riemerella anatipestifer]MBT0543940.1 hypothetical protein [Riemerella anatipestifer]MBT0545907.1 hypothetical protein [Riemerella anatipestifer]MBT0547843.1 hypothetical protein [Riemerella anatipestifer]
MKVFTIIKDNKIERATEVDLVIFLKNNGVSHTYRTERWGKVELEVLEKDKDIVLDLIASGKRIVNRGSSNMVTFRLDHRNL